MTFLRKFVEIRSSGPGDYEVIICNTGDDTVKIGIFYRISQKVLDRSTSCKSLVTIGPVTSVVNFGAVTPEIKFQNRCVVISSLRKLYF